jgi:hypothetical protein
MRHCGKGVERLEGNDARPFGFVAGPGYVAEVSGVCWVEDADVRDEAYERGVLEEGTRASCDFGAAACLT